MPHWMKFSPFAMRPYLSASESGGTGGGGESSDANAGGESGGNEDGKPFATFQDEKSFTARVKREGKAQMEARAKELGFDSLSSMEAAITAAKAQEDKNKSDLEREKEARQRVEAERDAANERVNDRLIRAEVKSIAADLDIVDADAAYALMARDNVAVDDKGDVQGVKAALESLLTSKPYLKKPDGHAARSGGEFKGGSSSKDESVTPGIGRLRNAYANPKRS